MLTHPLAAIVVNHNGGTLVLRCLESLLAGSRPPDRLIVVDSHSSDGSLQEIQSRFPQAEVFETQKNEGYAAALNLGIRQACSRRPCFLLLMNNDIVLDSRAVEILQDHWDDACGLIGPKVLKLEAPETMESAWGEICMNHVICRMVGEGLPDSERFGEPRDVDALLGCLLMTTCDVVEHAGPLDPDYFMYMEEIDYAWRIRRLGKRIRFVPSARIWHAGGHATDPSARRGVKTFYVRRNSVLFMRKHGRWRDWPEFLTLAGLSLTSFFLTLRWSGFMLRLRGYREGFRASIHPPATRKPLSSSAALRR